MQRFKMVGGAVAVSMLVMTGANAQARRPVEWYRAFHPAGFTMPRFAPPSGVLLLC